MEVASTAVVASNENPSFAVQKGGQVSLKRHGHWDAVGYTHQAGRILATDL